MKQTSRFLVPAAHPSLPGHFPGRPVVPGVLLLDEAFALILRTREGARLAAIEHVKFAAPVMPDQEVMVEWNEIAPDRLDFACFVAGRTILRGRARLASS
ncbi:MAG: hypothetical protein JO303_11870 [Caulobacteraceae bacterium]|nr:hypothetical protein [Caulobacteraceae bacterium]